ncbi:DUF5337 domain-containing protein [Rhodobacteraceae bacterium SC52]|nr:DUF5337 domain-containing protein [Rhodobacteraceae bacterium SC52]
MTQRSSDDIGLQTAKQARTASLVMAGTALLWMGAQFLGGALGLPARYAFLFDFAALAGLFWALVVTYQVWRKRRIARTGEE